MPGQPAKKRNSFVEFALIFAVVYLLTQFVSKTFFPQQNGPVGPQLVTLTPSAGSYKSDYSVILTLKNPVNAPIALGARCPSPALDLFRVDGAGSGAKITPIAASGGVLPCTDLLQVPAKGEVKIDLGSWKYSMISSVGMYEARIPADAKFVGTGATMSEVSARFALTEPGSITKAFRAFITKPFLNFLIFIASILPDHNLGIAIIVLTILVKLVLYIPTQHAMEGQRKMQKAQPHLDEIRKRHKDDPKKMQAETMRVWKEHGINPFQACLPTLIQLPILIGLFYVIRDGSSLALSRHLIYAPYLHLPWDFNAQFLGLNLLVPNVYIFPVLLVVLQFFQMKLSFAIAARKKKEKDGDKSKDPEKDSAQVMQQRMMLYGLPLMIGFFAISMPAAVCLYWGISTLFAVGQQWVVNRKV
ncbi:MAG: YidC/Oxa1 family membrane protein insertase [Candidatus Peregrinibacteria bacterium]